MSSSTASSQVGSTTTRVLDYGKLKMAGEITGDIGFNPPGLKFKGKQAITSRQLEETRAKLQIQRRTIAQYGDVNGQGGPLSQSSVTTRSYVFFTNHY